MKVLNPVRVGLRVSSGGLMKLYMLRRELAAAAAQREAVLEELNRTAGANGLDPSDYYDGNINTVSPSITQSPRSDCHT